MVTDLSLSLSLRRLRLVALAAHKFLLDVTHDTMQYQRIRSQNAATSSTAGGAGAAGASAAAATPSAPNGGATRTVLTVEDLSARYVRSAPTGTRTAWQLD